MMTAMRRASPNPDNSKWVPMIESVINNVMALITNRKSPSVSNVAGKVKIISIGLTSIFKIDKTRLAVKADRKLDT